MSSQESDLSVQDPSSTQPENQPSTPDLSGPEETAEKISDTDTKKIEEALFLDVPNRLPEPPYPYPFPETLNLYNGPATVNDISVSGDAVVELLSDRRNIINVQFQLPFRLGKELFDAGKHVSFGFEGFNPASGLIDDIQFGFGAGQSAMATLRARILHLSQPPEETMHIDFIGFNLPEWLGSPIKDGRSVSNARLVLDAGNFKVIIENHADRPKKDYLKQNGYTLTSVGRLERKDGLSFMTDDPEAGNALNALTWTFFFASANWVQIPALLTFIRSDERTWQEVKITKRSSFRDPQGWFNIQNTTSLKEVYQGLLIKLLDPLWDQPIREAINWYVDAHGKEGTAVGHLIWAQTGLELLGWVYLTQSPSPTHTEAAFDKSHASQKMRDLILKFGIDTKIPPKYKDLQAFADRLSRSGLVRSDDPLDGPSVINHVRNSFVHPRQRAKHIHMSQLTQSESMRLALEYLELCLLNILGVNSKIWIRSLGSISNPPWISSESNLTSSS